MAVLLTLCLAMAIPGVLAPHDPVAVHLENQLQPPSPTYPLGTDQFGRCVLSRLIHGARVTLGAAAIVVAVTSVVGVAVAAGAALGGRLVRPLALRVLDVSLALPSVAVAVGMVGLLGPGLGQAVAAVAVTSWAGPARVFRALFVAEGSAPYVLAARAVGASPRRILWRHIAPGVAGRAAVVLALALARAVLAFSSLSFLGLGPQPPVPEWGAMLQESRLLFFSIPSLMVYPGLCLSAVIGAATLLAERLTAVLDQRPVG